MHRQAQQEVEAAARRRLELLGRELESAGLLPLVQPGERGEGRPGEPRPGELTAPAPVAGTGRHARRTRDAPARSAMVRMLPETLHGRVGLTRGPVVLVVSTVVVALVLAGVVTLRTVGGSEAVGPPLRQRPAAPLVPSSSPSPGAEPSGSAGPTDTVTVDVAGKVRRPGVTTLPTGSRVVDALERAGGPRGRVDLAGLNLARVLVDGEQILVGRPAPPGGIAAGVAGGGVASGGAASQGPLVNLNTATGEQLETLPGVGPVTAQKILSWRETHGAFTTVDELLEIDGIGEKTFAELAPLVTL